jgi:pilus assembly protein Flp/PilA
MLFSASEKGQGLVEYALILVLVFLVVLVVLVILGPSIGNMYSNVNANL